MNTTTTLRDHVVSTDYFVSNGTGSVDLSNGSVGPAPDEVLIRTEFAGVNRGDVLGLRGAYGEPTPRGQRVGQDIVGIVEAAGSSHGAHLVGERVFGQIAGAWGRYATAAVTSVIPALDLEPETAATLPLPGFTAMRLSRQALRHAGDLQGKDVLITGGTGAVGSMLSQILLGRGASIWLLSRRADVPTPAGTRVVSSLDQVPEVAVAFESVGGEVLSQALHRLSPHGHLWWFGEASRRPATIDFFAYLARSPWHLHHFAHRGHDGNDADDLAELRDLVTSQRLKAPQHRVIGPTDLTQAIADIAQGITREKILVRF